MYIDFFFQLNSKRSLNWFIDSHIILSSHTLKGSSDCTQIHHCCHQKRQSSIKKNIYICLYLLGKKVIINHTKAYFYGNLNLVAQINLIIALFCSTDKVIEINVLEILKISFISHWYFYLIKTETYKI